MTENPQNNQPLKKMHPLEGHVHRIPRDQHMLGLSICRRAVAVLAPLILVFVGAAPAVAGDTIGSVDCNKDPTNPQCLITVGTPEKPGDRGSSGGSTCRDPAGAQVPCYVDGFGWYNNGCYWQEATGEDLAKAEQLMGGTPTGQRWLIGHCGYPPGSAGPRVMQLAAAPPSPQVLAAQAVKALRLPLPTIQLNPAPPAAQIVFVPTWVWLGAGSWGARSATAQVPGISVTATATPVTLVLTTGDGATVTCTGAGTPWTAATDPSAASPTCGHTYSRAGSYQLQATVTWTVSWAGGGVTGTVPALTTTATATVRVVEQQVINGSQGG